ncbi:hypothetical protein FA13DRAFT_1720300 [Coprinellus micaceus]|uniref:Uncharacterized protein n=1 Tax=Coprinellus micaceus TaxID=71717 RepID=A0A4Y7S9V3_COPMI|nr:hypothetical protein FA13DRAFT_1720300 [Coprinellus micaceus]
MTQAKATKRNVSELESDILPPALKRAKLAHTSSLKENEFTSHIRADHSISTKTKSSPTYRIVARAPSSSSREVGSEESPRASEPASSSETTTLNYRIVAPAPASRSFSPHEEIYGGEPKSPGSTTGGFKYRIVVPSPSPPSPEVSSSGASPSASQDSSRPLIIRIPPARRYSRSGSASPNIHPYHTMTATTTGPSPSRARRSKYTTDPLSRRAALEKIPAIQFIECTPYAVFCRACGKTHELERRGAGWYAHSWVKGHEQTRAHVKNLAKWMKRGGDQVRREDEEVQWKCVYWKVWCEEEGREVVAERVVRSEDAQVAEGMLEFWSSCGVNGGEVEEEVWSL